MDFNNNNENFNNSRDNFFQEIDSDNLKTSNISGSGISYGGEKNDNTKTILMVFFILFAVILLVIMGMKLSNRNTRNNTAEIPVIEGYKDIRTEHEMPKPNEIYDASIYKRDKDEVKDLAKKTEMKIEAEETIPATSSQAMITEETIPTIKEVREVKAVKVVPVKKPAVKPVLTTKSKKIIQKPRIKILNPAVKTQKLVEKKTEVAGEVEVLSEPVAMKKTAPTTGGNWYVQLVSTLSETSANAAWVKLKGQHPQLFAGIKYKVVKGGVNGKTYYRLRAIDFDVNSATEFCNKLKAANLTCFVGK